MPTKLNEYQLLRTLGKGAFSKVKLGYKAQDNTYYAIKVHRKDDARFNSDTRAIIMNEVKTIVKLKHQNIVNIIEFIDEAKVKKENG